MSLKIPALCAMFCLAALSGCCSWHCGHEHGGGGGLFSRGFRGCVQPDGCYGCGAEGYGCGCGVDGYGYDPVHYARGQRMQRLGRQNVARQGCAHGRHRGRHGHNPYVGGCGFDPCSCGYCGDCYGGFCDPCGFDCMDGCGCSECGGFSDGMVMDGGWTTSGPGCATCGNGMPTYESQYVEGNWEQEPVPHNAMPPAGPSRPEEYRQPAPGEPNPMPTTRGEYYMPRVMPSGQAHGAPGTQIESSVPGNPIQPVLWVPSGL